MAHESTSRFEVGEVTEMYGGEGFITDYSHVGPSSRDVPLRTRWLISTANGLEHFDVRQVHSVKTGGTGGLITGLVLGAMIDVAVVIAVQNNLANIGSLLGME